MTETALKKLAELHKNVLTIYSEEAMNQNNPESIRNKYAGMIKGYLNCLMSMGIITLKENGVLNDNYCCGVIVR